MNLFIASTPASDRSRPMVEKRIADMQALEQKQATPQPIAPVSPPTTQPPALPLATNGAGTAGVLVGTPSAPQADAGGSRPFYKRPWFYVAAGAVVLVGAAGIWALSGGQEIPQTPLGNQPVFQ